VIYHLSALGIQDKNVVTATVFPNPAINQLNIVSESLTNPDYTLYLYNAKGSLVRMYNLSVNNHKALITISELPVGHYFGRMISDKNLVEFRFIKE